ncbi:hypothetical protein CCACVL1_11319 [Corchorus capsularis]|uniref:Uncharacterized protein n=1 Tax=Corchorus capsularis TaxID=210143 RepID=A0A1R3ILZ1_COCAP|nr:hypothetical protein CCACVL1_11319 [Corchorus capsularis]
MAHKITFMVSKASLTLTSSRSLSAKIEALDLKRKIPEIFA